MKLKRHIHITKHFTYCGLIGYELDQDIMLSLCKTCEKRCAFKLKGINPFNRIRILMS